MLSRRPSSLASAHDETLPSRLRLTFHTRYFHNLGNALAWFQTRTLVVIR
jgi:hypothetical protein